MRAARRAARRYGRGRTSRRMRRRRGLGLLLFRRLLCTLAFLLWVRRVAREQGRGRRGKAWRRLLSWPIRVRSGISSGGGRLLGCALLFFRRWWDRRGRRGGVLAAWRRRCAGQELHPAALWVETEDGAQRRVRLEPRRRVPPGVFPHCEPVFLHGARQPTKPTMRSHVTNRRKP